MLSDVATAQTRSSESVPVPCSRATEPSRSANRHASDLFWYMCVVAVGFSLNAIQMLVDVRAMNQQLLSKTLMSNARCDCIDGAHWIKINTLQQQFIEPRIKNEKSISQSRLSRRTPPSPRPNMRSARDASAACCTHRFSFDFYLSDENSLVRFDRMCGIFDCVRQECHISFGDKLHARHKITASRMKYSFFFMCFRIKMSHAESREILASQWLKTRWWQSWSFRWNSILD